VIYRTDSAEHLEKTIVNSLTVGLEIISKSKLYIYCIEENKMKCCYGEIPDDVSEEKVKCMNKVFIYITGDLAFLPWRLT